MDLCLRSVDLCVFVFTYLWVYVSVYQCVSVSANLFVKVSVYRHWQIVLLKVAYYTTSNARNFAKLCQNYARIPKLCS